MAIIEHRSSSLRETLAISIPFMCASISSYLMYVVDRFILASYSLEALNAAVPATSITWAFWGGISVMAGMSEVFMAQHRFKNPFLIGGIIWQAIWMTIVASLVLIPIGFATAGRLYESGSAEYGCFFWSMIFGTLDPLSYALITFLVGQGKGRFVLLLTLTMIACNACCDCVLIFGLLPGIPALGAKGASIARGISMAIQVAVLIMVFPEKREPRLLWHR